MHGGEDALTDVFARLLAVYGEQRWWPAETPFEIAAGAVLVQRTAWRNAASAVAALKQRGLLDPATLAGADLSMLADVIRPAGFAAAKADYLRNVAAWFADSGTTESIAGRHTDALRAELLAVRGVGPETADAILLYLFHRPVWIADAYSARILGRLSGATFGPDRQRALLRPWIDAARVGELQELHALFVAHAQRHCRARPRCEACPLHGSCAASADRAASAR